MHKHCLETSSKLITIAGIVISFLAVFLPLYSDIITNPDIKINLGPTKYYDEYISTEILVKNTGLKPATNLRLTINPSDEIINYKSTFYTEDISLKSNGPNSLIGKMDRLANVQTVKIQVNLTATELNQYSIFATHDSGSTSFYHNKEGDKQPIDPRIIITILIGLIAALMGGLASKEVAQRIEIKQRADNGSANLNNISAVNSQIIVTANSQSENVSKTTFVETEKKEVKSNVKEIIGQIGKEKISNLLHKAKIIAIEEKDKKFQRWIELELNGYVPPGKTMTRGEVQKKGYIPEYRDINGRFYIQTDDGDINEMKYPIFFGNTIQNIETSIEKMKKGGKLYIAHKFPENISYLGGQEGDLEIATSELEGIIHGVENRLSKFLEQKLIS